MKYLEIPPMAIWLILLPSFTSSQIDSFFFWLSCPPLPHSLVLFCDSVALCWPHDVICEQLCVECWLFLCPQLVNYKMSSDEQIAPLSPKTSPATPSVTPFTQRKESNSSSEDNRQARQTASDLHWETLIDVCLWWHMMIFWGSWYWGGNLVLSLTAF